MLPTAPGYVGSGVGVLTPDAVMNANAYVLFALSDTGGKSGCDAKDTVLPDALPGPRITFQPFAALLRSSIATYALPETGEAVVNENEGV